MNRLPDRQYYHVRWFIDTYGIRDDVTVEIDGGKLLGIAAGKSAEAVDLGDVALIPALVNAHTHLEFSLFDRPIPTNQRFTDWIRAIVAHRRAHPESTPAAIRNGIDESLRAGTSLIGEIATAGWSVQDYASNGFCGVVYQEFLGLTDERIATQLDLVRTICDRADSVPDGVRFGLSSHAPYSVHPELFQAVMEAATRSSLPVAMHLAETPAELELLADGTGEFREMLTEFGLWREGLFGGRRPLDYLSALAECPRALIVHGNYLDDSEITFLAQHPTMTLVYCPRTHAAFGHSPHPWRRLLELGGSVAIGTDSRASNPDLSLFAELQFLAQLKPDVSNLELLRLGTGAGRLALIGEELLDDKSADFCVIGWPSATPSNPMNTLFGPGNRVLATMIAGQWRFVAPGFLLPG